MQRTHEPGLLYSAVAVALAWASPNFVMAQTHGDGQPYQTPYTMPYEVPYEMAAKGYAKGLVERHLYASCDLEEQTNGRVVIANGEHCLEAAQELRDIFKGQYLEADVEDWIKTFLEQYHLVMPI